MKEKLSLPDIRQREIDRVQAYKDTFKSESGQKVLKDLNAMFYDADLLDRTSAHNTNYNLGLRDVVRHIQETLEATPYE